MTSSPSSSSESITGIKLTMDQLWNAQQNVSMISNALIDVRLLLQQKEALQAEVEALKREKAQLSGEIRLLRGDVNLPVKRVTSLPDLHAADKEDDSTYDSEDYDSDEEVEQMSKSERLANAPRKFVCPLTLQVMKHPMQQKGTKTNYERRAILEWIYFGKGTCPLTRKKLHPGDFQENLFLKREIDHWCRMNGLDVEEEEEDLEGSSGEFKIPDMTPEQEKECQARLCRTKSKGSDSDLMNLRDRILSKRDDRVRRRQSGGGLM